MLNGKQIKKRWYVYRFISSTSLSLRQWALRFCVANEGLDPEVKDIEQWLERKR